MHLENEAPDISVHLGKQNRKVFKPVFSLNHNDIHSN